MTRTTVLKASALAILGLYCLGLTFDPAQAAETGEMGGGLTAYQFDGIYKGESRLVAADGGSCEPGQATAVAVRRGRLSLTWRESQVFEATIADDGRFFVATDSLVRAEKRMAIVPTLQGRISAAGLLADYGTRWCHYRLTASLPPLQQRVSEQIPPPGAQQ
jgi:hypothetical protein